MKHHLAFAALLAAIALPALAQPYGAPPPGTFWYGAPQAFDGRIEFLAVRLRRLGEARRISPDAYRGLEADLDRVRLKYRDLRTQDGGHLNGPDASYVWQRLDGIAEKTNWDSRLGY